MTGIGVRLNKFFGNRSITASLAGVAYGTSLTVAPMVLVIGVLLLLEWILEIGRAHV